MEEHFGFLWSVTTWFWGIMFLLMTALIFIDVACISNYNSQAQNVLARSGGLTENAAEILEKQSYHQLAKVTTVKYDKNGHLIPGDRVGKKVPYGDTIDYVIWPTIPVYYHNVINAPQHNHIMSDARQDSNT